MHTRNFSERKKQARLPETRNLNARRKKDHVHMQSGGVRGEAGEASVLIGSREARCGSTAYIHGLFRVGSRSDACMAGAWKKLP
jgi:hypothetical protein